MSPIASTTVMRIKPFISAWARDFSFDSYDFSTDKDNGVENNFDIGIVGKVFRTIKHSSKGPFVNAPVWKGDIKCLLLICCGPKSDFSYKTALSLEGLPIKLNQQKENQYLINSFDDVIDKEARDNLKDIDAGKKEFVPAGTTATVPINNVEDSAEEDFPAGTTATVPINNVEDSAEDDFHAGTTATGPINNAENLGEVEIHKVTNTVAHEIKSDSESEYIEIKISLRKR